jgi:hypothetical protein
MFLKKLDNRVAADSLMAVLKASFTEIEQGWEY